MHLVMHVNSKSIPKHKVPRTLFVPTALNPGRLLALKKARWRTLADATRPPSPPPRLLGPAPSTGGRS